MGLLSWLILMVFSIGLRYFNPPISILILLAFLIGCFGKGWLGIYNASITETVSEDNIGIAIGLSSILLRSGLMIASPIFGYIADLKGSYNLSWSLLGIIMVFASFGQYLSFKKNKIKESV